MCGACCQEHRTSLTEYGAVWSGKMLPTFRRNALTPSSWSESKPSKELISAETEKIILAILPLAGYFVYVFLRPEAQYVSPKRR
jgi:hypothetical protein